MGQVNDGSAHEILQSFFTVASDLPDIAAHLQVGPSIGRQEGGSIVLHISW